MKDLEYPADNASFPSISSKIEEERNLYIKQLRVAQFEVDPYVRGLTVYHRNNTIDGQGKVTWLYKQKDGKSFRHVVGRKTCVATLRREIEEMQEGKTTKEVEAKTQKAIDDKDWVALYGDEDIAMELEGKLDGTGRMAESAGGAQSQQQAAPAAREQQQQQRSATQQKTAEPEHEEEHEEHDDEENKGYIAAAAGGVAAAAGGAAAIAGGAASGVGNTITGAASAVTGYFTGGQQDDHTERAPQSKATTPGEFYDAQNADTPSLGKALDADEHLSGVSNGSAYKNSSAPASKDTGGFIDYSARRRKQYDDEGDEEVEPVAARAQPVMRPAETKQPEKSASTGGIMSGLAGAGSAVIGGLAGTLGYGDKDKENGVPNGKPQTNGNAPRSMNGSATDSALLNGHSRANGSAAHSVDDQDDMYNENDYADGRARSMRRKSQAQRMGDAYYGGSARRLSSGPAYQPSTYKGKQEAMVEQKDSPKKGGVGRRLSGIFGKN